MTDNDKQYGKILASRKEEAFIFLNEAKKVYRQAIANYKTADRDLAAWEKEQGGNDGLYTAQENDGTRDTL